MAHQASLQESLLQIVLILLPEQSLEFYAMVGDVPYFSGIRLQNSVAMLCGLTIALSSQLLTYYNHRNDIKPTFLTVFSMLSEFMLTLLFIIHYSAILCHQAQVLVFIERMGQNRVGFYCWRVFLITRFRGYENSDPDTLVADITSEMIME
ncbi:unnamed protein product [Oppiella nova]|uniref:Uncharacterized protein n=1 Tax=Oppiella nova TaxID=334625 RepID=A0A7R9QT75_9ACAR|nr:unnamed protein product [Oppiella nova]CAG2173493.1 unnamed protein product [Oppiella nova]